MIRHQRTVELPLVGSGRPGPGPIDLYAVEVWAEDECCGFGYVEDYALTDAGRLSATIERMRREYEDHYGGRTLRVVEFERTARGQILGNDVTSRYAAELGG